MTRLGLVDRHGLLGWADSIGARSELPRLVRRLVLETGQGVVELGFPAGEGVSLRGWDGTVRADAATSHIPLGPSVWELSVDGSPGTKADEDYAKRTTAPGGAPTVECTYVAVSLRPWAKRSDWARDRTAEGSWKEVRAFGVDDVDTWLEYAPVTHAWLSELMGLHPHGLETVQSWWARWSSATAPPFPAAIVVAGREAARVDLRNALTRPGELVSIHGSADDVAAFVASCVMAEGTSDGGALLARTAYVTEVEAWRRLRAHPSPLVLVALTEEVAAEFALGSAHVLIVATTGTARADIELASIDSLVAADVLKAEGLPAREADAAGRVARLSLLAARRQLAVKRELLEPPWARTPAAKTVRRLALMGRWQEGFDADQALVEKTVDVPYGTLREEIAALAWGGDPLLARLGDEVGVVSAFDAWLVLRSEVRKDDLEAFHEAARTVFAETDPRWQLPQEDRWRASLLGKNAAYSRGLRQGLATTLALLGAHGGCLVSGARLTAREWAGWIIRELVSTANADVSCQLWQSLTDVLPLLAEAAPSEFLEGVRVGVTGESPLLRDIFGDGDGDGRPFGPESAHTGLLWALETCAWSSDHFGAVVDLLARLDEIDPGGRLENRPFASLVGILRPWHLQNSVGTERRLDVIDVLRERHNEVAWKLLLGLLPEAHGIAMGINAPRFRDWKPENLSVTTREYWSVIDQVCARVVDEVGHDPARCIALIGKIDDLPPAASDAILARLDKLSADSELSGAQRVAIWEALRAMAARHREYSDAEWALPADQVAAIEETAARFEPVEPTERYRWLFSEQMPEIPDIARGDNYDEYTAALVQTRAEAAAAIADSTDWAGGCSFALSLELPGMLGRALAVANRHEHEAELLRLLESTDDRAVDLATGYFGERFRNEGWPWLEGHLGGADVTPQQAARLFLCSHDYPKAWQDAQATGEEAAKRFWLGFLPWGLGPAFPHVDFVAESLLEVGRTGAALELIALYSRPQDDISDLRSELIARGLEALLECGSDDPEGRALLRHRLVEFFAILERSGLARERLAQLEWAYLPAFGIDHRPDTLSQVLSENADFFVDVIRRVYRPRGNEGGEETETMTETEGEKGNDAQRAAIATNAYRLLSDWRTPPGLRADGTIDDDTLGAWVDNARGKLRESGHLESGDVQIGHMLAWGPVDVDGSQLCVQIRDLLERLQSAEIESGLGIAVRNSRGVTTRGTFDGGEQERVLAAAYAAEAVKFADRWPRSAALMRDLAEDYEREARQHDEEAERRRLGFSG